MSSNINPSNIDQDYPIAGSDNDSQGFRDNFTNIQTNFANAQDEINDLQNNVLLKSALIGDTLDNDLSGAIIKSALMQDVRGKVSSNSNATGTTSIDVKDSTYYKLTSSGNIELSFINWPIAGQSSNVYVEIEITNTSHIVTLPVTAAGSAGGLQNYLNNQIHYSNVGTFVYKFSTIDAGSSLTVSEESRSRNDFYRTIATSKGTSGDASGMIAFDATNAYFCVADYDGTSDIWSKLALAGGAW